MRNGILIKYGEIAIKGNNRRNFEGLLIANIRERLADIGQYRVSKEQGRLLVEPLEGSSADEASWASAARASLPTIRWTPSMRTRSSC